MDFKNLNSIRELKRFCITGIELILNFCVGEFKRFCFGNFVYGDCSSTFNHFDDKVSSV